MSTWTVPGYADASELGTSTSGRTMLARHTPTGARVAIRYLADDLREDGAYLDRYRSVARLMADLDAPNVAALYEYVEADHGVATVREYVSGASLRTLLASRGRMSPESALCVLKGMLTGLRAAHAAGTAHGDVRPENVLVDVTGETKVSDFGVATAPGEPDADVVAATTSFVDSLRGGVDGVEGDVASALPKRLRGLLPALEAGDVQALLDDIEASACKAYGRDWETTGRTRLARRMARHTTRR